METAELDRLRTFHIPALGTRGVWAHLDVAWLAVAADHDYPQSVSLLLGQALAATALLAGNLKSPGRLSLHLKSTGALRTLFAECDQEGHVRGIARIAEDFDTPGDIDLTRLPESMLGITLERPDHERYQGLIAVEHASLGRVLEAYFAQSEQLHTRLWLSANASRCAGLLLQQLPGGPGTGAGFEEAAILASTMRAEELLSLDSVTLLGRLFAEHDVRLANGIALSFACTCSRERVGRMFESLGREEAFAALADDRAEVRCEFCNRLWIFDRIDLTRIFLTGGWIAPAEPTAH